VSRRSEDSGHTSSPETRINPVRNGEWMVKQLEGTGLTMIGSYSGLVTGVELQCAKDHVFKESAGVVAYGKSCPLCRLEEEDNEPA